ncbi:hypothetical protein K3495_g4058 [Podosphaera aphanis]|nr:hypothetical protein K3495_g4058 [Podosphaera aphanis]
MLSCWCRIRLVSKRIETPGGLGLPRRAKRSLKGLEAGLNPCAYLVLNVNQSINQSTTCRKIKRYLRTCITIFYEAGPKNQPITILSLQKWSRTGRKLSKFLKQIVDVHVPTLDDRIRNPVDDYRWVGVAPAPAHGTRTPGSLGPARPRGGSSRRADRGAERFPFPEMSRADAPSSLIASVVQHRAGKRRCGISARDIRRGQGGALGKDVLPTAGQTGSEGNGRGRGRGRPMNAIEHRPSRTSSRYTSRKKTSGLPDSHYGSMKCLSTDGAGKRVAEKKDGADEPGCVTWPNGSPGDVSTFVTVSI